MTSLFKLSVFTSLLVILLPTSLWPDDAPKPVAIATPDPKLVAERDKFWQQAQTLAAEGQLTEAIAAGEQAVERHRRLFGDDHVGLMDFLEWLSYRHLAAKQPDEALRKAKRFYELAEKHFGESHWRTVSAKWCRDYIERLANIDRDTLIRMLTLESEAQKFAAKGESAKAAAKALELAEIEERVLGPEHPFYANSQASIVDWLWSAGKAAEAEKHAVLALGIRRKSLGMKHPDTAGGLHTLAVLYETMGDYAKAEPLYIESLDIRETVLGHEHAATATSLHALAWLSALKGDYAKALPLNLESVNIYRKVHGSDHSDTTASLNNLAMIYQLMEQYAQAEPLLRECLQINMRIVGREHASTATSFDNLAKLYQAMGEFVKAEPLARECLEIRTKTLSREHADTVASLKNLAMLLEEQNQYAQAEPLFQETLDIRLKTLGRMHHSTATSFHDLAWLYKLMGEFTKAKKLFRESLEIYTQVLGREHLNTTTNIRNLARVYQSLRDYANAESLFRENLEIRRKVLGREQDHTMGSLNDLAEFYVARGDYAKAERLYREGYDIRLKTLGREHHKTATLLNNLAVVTQSMGDFPKAEQLYRESLDISRMIHGPEHLETTTCLTNLAGVYGEMANYTKAETLYREALKIRERELGRRHQSTAKVLAELAALYQKTGDYAKSEPLHRESLETCRKTLGREHHVTALCLSRFALLYLSMGDPAKAEPMYREALRIHEKTLGSEHPDTAVTRHELAHLYLSIGDHEKAEPLYKESLDVIRRTLGNEHPDAATGLSSLAMVHAAMEDYAQAEPLFREAHDIRVKVLGREHPSVANSLSNLALVYELLGDHAKAEPAYREALAIQKKVLGHEHPETTDSESKLGMYYVAMQKLVQAEPLLRSSVDAKRRFLDHTAGVQSERQQLLLAEQSRMSLDAWLAVAADAEVGVEERYARLLSWKGAIYAAQARTEDQLDSPQTKAAWSKLRQLRQQLARVALTTLDLRSANVEQNSAERSRLMAELTEEIEQLEVTLARQSGEFRQTRLARRMTPNQLRQSLPADCVLVDFVDYQHLLPPREGSTKLVLERRIAAFVVRKEGETVWINCGLQKPIAEAVSVCRQAHVPPSEQQQLELFLRPIIPQQRRQAEQTLRKLLWEPLVAHLEGVKTVLIAPDGPLHGLPFGALPGKKEGTYLLEEVAIGVIPVPQAIGSFVEADRDAAKTDNRSLLLVGEVDYDSPPGLLDIASTTSDRGETFSKMDTPRGTFRFAPLPSGFAELSSIDRSFHTAFPEGTSEVLEKENATESLFRKAVPRHRYLHLITHGFFAPEEMLSILHQPVPGGREPFMPVGHERTIVGHHPGSLSGIALAGANTASKSNEDDGILTALEVSALNLRHADLVVLAACETGLGKVAGGEGVLGLQRAFQLAGARTTVTSLWTVRARVTVVLMQRFYDNLWVKRLPKLEALREAQLWVMRGNGLLPAEIVKDSDIRLPPDFWAAWILSGDWR